MKKLFLIILLAFSSTPVFADFDSAKAAYDRGDYARALGEFRPSAEKGDAKAQYYLGQMYEHGLGVQVDNNQSMSWYLKAAQLGNVDAQFYLGWVYHNGGVGIPEDYKQAMTWYLKAAAQGDAAAQASLGQMYEYGLGVPKDYERAVSWDIKAAEQGFEPALMKLAMLYANGPGGFPKDAPTAYMWANILAAKGDKLGEKLRVEIERNSPPSQIAEGQRLTREWLAKHGDRKNK